MRLGKAWGRLKARTKTLAAEIKYLKAASNKLLEIESLSSFFYYPARGLGTNTS